MERQLTAAKLSHEFVEAVDGRELTPVEWLRVVDAEAVARYPWWLTPGAVGCILSHRLVYERIAETGQRRALVLEDDARLPPAFASIADVLAEHVADDDVLLLNFRSFEPCRLSASDAVTAGEHELMRPVDPSQVISALAYIVGVRAAERMAQMIIPVRFAADSWGEYVTGGAIASLRCAFPRPVVPSKTVTSTIRHGDAGGRPSFAKQVLTLPVDSLRQANRWRIARQMTRVEIVH